MSDQISTIVNSEKDLSSDAEGFYRKYWSETGVVKEETLARNQAIIKRFFPSGLCGKSILEVGVGGEGGLLLQLRGNNDVCGMDVSDAAIANCRRFGIDVVKANLDRDSVPFPDDHFDVIFAFEVFEHFANPQHALEEIRRVLKPEGIFISSIPATCTYHWPRLFYPALFERGNYHEFLMINGFRVTGLNDWLQMNSYRRYQVLPDVSSWSWYAYAEKPGNNDTKTYLETGMHFWEKRNEYGIRTRPIEAIDMFRKCAEISPEDEQVKLMLVHALVYRAINNDPEEFFKLVGEIISKVMTPGRDDKATYLGKLLLIDVEATRLGFNIMKPDEFRALKTQLAQMGNSGGLLDMINHEESINRNLTSLGKSE